MWSQEMGKKLRKGGGKMLKRKIKYTQKKSKVFLRKMRLKGSGCWLWFPPSLPNYLHVEEPSGQERRPGLLTSAYWGPRHLPRPTLPRAVDQAPWRNSSYFSLCNPIYYKKLAPLWHWQGPKEALRAPPWQTGVSEVIQVLYSPTWQSVQENLLSFNKKHTKLSFRRISLIQEPLAEKFYQTKDSIKWGFIVSIRDDI